MSGGRYEFTSAATTGDEAGFVAWRKYLPRRSGRGTLSPFASVALKVGLCAAACAAVLIVSRLSEPAEQSASADIYEDEDDGLGSLHFVSGQSIISVFSAGSELSPPVAYSASEALQDGEILALSGEAGEYAFAPASGTVLAAGENELLGCYVTIRHDNDTSTTCYGLASVSVEEGQPVERRDTIGTVGASGRVFVSATVGGRPQQPSSLFGIGD